MDASLPAAALVAFVVALVTTPAGVSGAVFLLPVQVGALGVPNPAVTPTSLVYNLLATPPAILRRWRDGALDVRLAASLLAFCVPGVLVGAVLRVEVLASRAAVLAMIGVVLTGLGGWLLVGRPRPPREGPGPGARTRGGVSLAAGVLGGAYGIGGGSVIAPTLTALGMPAHRVAPAALATTFVTSVAGIAAFELIAVASDRGAVAPDWAVGIALGVGGALGGLVGAGLQRRLPEARLRRLLGAVAVPVGLLHLAFALAGG